MSAVIELDRDQTRPKTARWQQLLWALERRPILALAVLLLAVSVAAAFGTLFKPGVWFAMLAKPAWNPPSSWYGPIWMVLYLMNAIAAWRVLRAGDAGVALLAWLVHLIPNALWSYFFFGLHRMDWAVLNIVLLVFSIVTVITLFYQRDKWAAFLLIPYLLWCCFAAFLNWTLFSLNIAMSS